MQQMLPQLIFKCYKIWLCASYPASQWLFRLPGSKVLRQANDCFQGFFITTFFLSEETMTDPHRGRSAGYTKMQTTNSNMAQREADDESLIRALDNQAALLGGR